MNITLNVFLIRVYHVLSNFNLYIQIINYLINCGVGTLRNWFDLIQPSIHAVFLHISCNWYQIFYKMLDKVRFFKILANKHPHHILNNTLIIAPVDFDAKLEEHIGHLETSWFRVFWSSIGKIWHHCHCQFLEVILA